MRLSGKPGYSPVWDRLTVRVGALVAEAWAFAKAARQRLGEDGVRELVRDARGTQDGPGQRTHASVQDRAREAERERLGLRQGPQMGR